jgi:hypothetical protein
MERMLAEMKTNHERMEAKADANLREMKAEIRTNQEEMKTNQERMETKIDANNVKAEFLGENMWTSQEGMKSKVGAVVFRMDINHARREDIQEQMKAKMNINKERTKAETRSCQEETKVTLFRPPSFPPRNNT